MHLDRKKEQNSKNITSQMQLNDPSLRVKNFQIFPFNEEGKTTAIPGWSKLNWPLSALALCSGVRTL